MNRAKKLLSLFEISKYVPRTMGTFEVWVELEAPSDYEGKDYFANVLLRVDAEYERPDPSVGHRGGWFIDKAVIARDFKFMGTEYKAGSPFSPKLVEYVPEFSQIIDADKRTKAFEQWLESEVAEIHREKKRMRGRDV